MNDLRNHLQESHKDLTQWFLFHQECLLLGEDELAQKAFGAFSSYLTHHINYENDIVLPALRSIEDDLRWKTSLYKKEHNKIESLLEKIEKKLSQYYLFEKRRKRLALLEVLDDEQSFKHVMEHHEQREEQDQFLFLEKVLFEEDVSQWLEINNNLKSEYSDLMLSLKVCLRA